MKTTVTMITALGLLLATKTLASAPAGGRSEASFQPELLGVELSSRSVRPGDPFTVTLKLRNAGAAPAPRDLRLYRRQGAVSVFCEHNHALSPVNDFDELHTWLLSKLMWNPDQDDKRLIREFLDGYYGAAGAGGVPEPAGRQSGRQEDRQLVRTPRSRVARPGDDESHHRTAGRGGTVVVADDAPQGKAFCRIPLRKGGLVITPNAPGVSGFLTCLKLGRLGNLPHVHESSELAHGRRDGVALIRSTNGQQQKMEKHDARQDASSDDGGVDGKHRGGCPGGGANDRRRH